MAPRKNCNPPRKKENRIPDYDYAEPAPEVSFDPFARPPRLRLGWGADSSEWAYAVQEHLKREQFEHLPEFHVVYPHDPNYVATVKQAFAFMRRHARGRYSDNTFMKVMGAAEDADAVTPTDDDRALPLVVIGRAPYSYDDMTEVKTGGIVGFGLTWRNENGRTILCSHSERRRAGIAKVLLYMLGSLAGDLNLWVGRNNTEAQTFLLQRGYYPTAINNRGSVRYSNNDHEGEI